MLSYILEGAGCKDHVEQMCAYDIVVGSSAIIRFYRGMGEKTILSRSTSI